MNDGIDLNTIPLSIKKELFKRHLSGFPLIFIHQEGHIDEINESASRLLLIPCNEIHGAEINDLFQFLGMPVSDYHENVVFEALVNRRDSSVFPSQVHVIPLDEEYSMAILSDLSIRNRLRDQLVEQRNLLETFFNAIQDHVYMFDSKNAYLLNNKSHLHFLNAKNQEEVQGKKIEDFFEPKLAQELNQDNLSILSGEKSEIVKTIEVFDGNWFEVKKSPLKDPLTQEIKGIVGVSRNVTEQIKTEEKLRQVQRLESLGLLAGGIAHDFNNLLTVVVGLADTAALMMESVSPDQPMTKISRDDLLETLHEIRQAGQRASGLTQKLLAVGRQQIVEMRPLPLNDVIREMSSVLQGVLKSVDKSTINTRLDHRLGLSLPFIFADRSQIEQVILNLTVNARDAIQDRIQKNPSADYIPAVSLKTFYDLSQKEVVLEVQDNGSGMTEEVRRKAFDPFFTTKSLGQGTGLGLASVYGILQQSHAYIQIDTELGVGTVFRIRFPEFIPPSKKEDAISHEAKESVKRKILYVEDDIVIRTLVRRNLQLQGFEVIEAENGLTAWDKYQQNPHEYALLLTDLLMPKMSGVELCRRIRELNPKQAILCVSGYTNENTEGLLVLHKPFTIQKLTQRIQEVLSNINAS